MALLEIDGLTTHLVLPRRTVRAVDGVSFQIEAGETVGLVGESGSGKSMTGASILRLLPEGGGIVGGSVRLAGRDLTALPEAAMARVRGREIGMVFQDPMTALNPTMNIGDQIAESLLIHQVTAKAEVRDRTLKLLAMVGVPRPPERISAYPHQLSGGLRQRVCIAIALACQPRLLIADEPTTALDVSIQDQILGLIERLKREFGMAVLLITHDMGVIAEHADRVLVMYAGQIIESASRTALFTQTRHPYTEALLAAVPSVTAGERTVLATIPGAPPDLANPAGHCRFAPRCAYATQECARQMPVLCSDEDGHAVACFHPRSAYGMPDGVPAQITVRDQEPAPGPSAEPLLVLDAVVKEFPVRGGLTRRAVGSVKAVSGVSLTVYPGETYGLVGESGCGKTTIGRLMVGLEKPDSGTVTVQGREISRLQGRSRRRERRDLQMVFQDPYSSLDPRMRVHSILAEPMVVQRGFTKAERNERVAQLLREVGLSASSGRQLPREFSGGQRQRIGFARALALGPRLIVADEPVSALDVSIRSQLLNLMVRLQEEHDLALVMVSHDLSVVRYIADRVGSCTWGSWSRPARPPASTRRQRIPIPLPCSRRFRSPIRRRGRDVSGSRSVASCLLPSTRRQAAASARAANGRRTSARRSSRPCFPWKGRRPAPCPTRPPALPAAPGGRAGSYFVKYQFSGVIAVKTLNGVTPCSLVLYSVNP